MVTGTSLSVRFSAVTETQCVYCAVRGAVHVNVIGLKLVFQGFWYTIQYEIYLNVREMCRLRDVNNPLFSVPFERWTRTAVAAHNRWHSNFGVAQCANSSVGRSVGRSVGHCSYNTTIWSGRGQLSASVVLTHWIRGHLNCLNARYRGF
jgi:hypothetical protein